MTELTDMTANSIVEGTKADIKTFTTDQDNEALAWLDAELVK